MVDVGLGVLNELQPGSYAYMDYNYVGIEWDAEGGPPPFRVASTVLASVISQSHLGHVVVDAGFKALSSDNGVPRVKGYPEWTFQFAGDEYGQINVPGTDRRPSIGDVLELIPSHCDTTAALHRQCIGVRGGRVNAIWDVIAHGMHD
jgi:D-serine deaminase-like pyridoxal phosphate-dependent protein